jgi:RNA polymerase primary sigma factor
VLVPACLVRGDGTFWEMHLMALTVERNRNVASLAQASLQNIPDRRRLSRSEERELSALIDAGDQAARNQLVQANLGLVVTIAQQFLGRGLELDDLTGEGNLGLIRAAKEFKPEFGTRFSTYAAFWIKQAIRCALINTATTIRLPSHMVRLLTKWRRAERALLKEAGRPPRFEAIASRLRLTEAQKSMVEQALVVGRLKHEGDYCGESGNRLAEVWDRQTPSEDRAESREEWAVTARRMEYLESRERAVLALRYGLEDESLTFQAIGRRLGLTREGVRKVELRALRKLGDDQIERASHRHTPEQSQVSRRSGRAVPAPHVPSGPLPRNGNCGDPIRFKRCATLRVTRNRPISCESSVSNFLSNGG